MRQRYFDAKSGQEKGVRKPPMPPVPMGGGKPAPSMLPPGLVGQPGMAPRANDTSATPLPTTNTALESSSPGGGGGAMPSIPAGGPTPRPMPPPRGGPPGGGSGGKQGAPPGGGGDIAPLPPIDAGPLPSAAGGQLFDATPAAGSQGSYKQQE